MHHTSVMLYISAETTIAGFEQEDVLSFQNRMPLSFMSAYIIHDHYAYDASGQIIGSDVGQTDEYKIRPDDIRPAGGGPLKPDGEWQGKSIADPGKFEQFLNSSGTFFGDTNYIHRILSLWGHGGSLMMLDEDPSGTGTPLQASIVDFAKALSNSNKRYRNKKRFNILIFDACYMGMVESLNEFVGETDLVVASSRKVPGTGFPYEAVIAAIQAKEVGDSSHKLAEQIRNAYNASYIQRLSTSTDRVFLYKIDELPACIEALNALGTLIGSQLTGGNRAVVKTALQMGAKSGSIGHDGFAEVTPFLAAFQTALAPLTEQVRTPLLKASQTLASCIAKAFLPQPDDFVSKTQSPLIWSPITTATFGPQSRIYGALKSSQHGNGGWMAMWREFQKQ
jgi:hypothetical protein